jgi:hypothetical protein
MLGIAPSPAQLAAQHRFESGPIDALVRGLLGRSDVLTGPFGRDDALSIAAVKRGRDGICSLATLPLTNYRGREIIARPFLDQPDPDVPRSVMLAQTFEDLLCDGISWWIKTAVDSRGFPLSARRLAPGVVSVNPPQGRTPAPLPSGIDPRGGVLYVDGEPVAASLLIRFDSPNRAMLQTGQRAIRKALLLDALAAMYADNPRPLETFTDSDDQTITPYDDDQVVEFLASYRAARKRGGPAYIPGEVKRLDVSAPSPAELQLVELQRQAALELALFMGVDPEDVGVSTTSRTYFNATDRRLTKINETYAGYLAAVTDRLSMQDITPRGQRVRWDLTDYLKPDPATLVTYWRGLFDMGAATSDWIADQAGVPLDGRPAAAPAALPAGGDPGQNSRPPIRVTATVGAPLPQLAGRFDGGPALTFAVREFDAQAAAPTVDVAQRTITGLALPYGAVARKFGVGFRFRAGSLEYDPNNLSRLKVLKDHGTPVGVHTGVTDGKAGPVVQLHVLDGPEGSPIKAERDQLLYDAEHGLYDGLSVGVDFSLDPADGDVEWNDREQVYDVLRATWRETSATPMPAFDDARVTKVAASLTGGTMNCQHCQRPHPQGMSCAVAAQLYPAPPAQPAALPAGTYAQPTPGQPAPQPQPQPSPQPPAPVSADALNAAFNALVGQMQANGQIAAAPPVAQPVNPTALPLPGAPATGGQTFTGTVRVNEPEPYRRIFDRRGGEILLRGTHDFSQDLYAWFSAGDAAAHDRALSWAQRQFDVATTDVDELNPTRNRPEMYVDQRAYRYPLSEATYKGPLTDITPFMFPKFSSASGLVAAHTEGTEPSSGTFVVTKQTVTPTGYSGKAKIHREVWDQGGNPQVSTLIWNQMVKGHYEAREAAVVAELNAGSFTALATLTAGNADTGQTLSGEIEAGMTDLQFVRGGFRFTDTFTQADLYKALAAAKDDQGRPLYPMIGPANANGQAGSRFGYIDVAGMPFWPEWALAAAGQTAAAKSYMLERDSVHLWASAPQRLTFETEVANIYLGIWGYMATAVSDTNGVRTISWDPVA